MLQHPRAHKQSAPRGLQIRRIHLGQPRGKHLLHPHFHREEIATDLRQGIQLLGGELHLFVFEQAPHQLGPRVRLSFLHCPGTREKHA